MRLTRNERLALRRAAVKTIDKALRSDDVQAALSVLYRPGWVPYVVGGAFGAIGGSAAAVVAVVFV